MPQVSWSKENPRRLAPQIVDKRAKEEPDRLYARIPISNAGYQQGFRDITYGDLANAVNGIAYWLQEKVGIPSTTSNPTFETICYLGPHEFKHPLLLLGAIKAGYKMMFLSLRETLQAHANALQQMECTKIIVPAIGSIPMVDTIVEALPETQVLELPPLDHFIEGRFAHFPYDKTFDEAQNEPFAVVATSGTTSLPKTIVYTHLWISKWVAERYLAPPDGYESLDYLMMGKRLLNPASPSHAGTTWSQVVWPLFCEDITILPPRDALPTAELTVEGTIAAKADAVVWFPPMIESLALRPDLIQRLAKEAPYTTLFFCGGCISRKAGETISAHLKLWNLTGSTETGIWPGLRKKGPWDPRIWQCFLFHPAIGVELRQISPVLFSGIIVSKGIPADTPFQPAFVVFPDQKEIDSSDVFSRVHLEGYDDEVLWTMEGRKDDLQIMLSATKWNPTNIEHKIAFIFRDTAVSQVMIASHGLPYSVLVLETSFDTSVRDVKLEQQKLVEYHAVSLV